LWQLRHAVLPNLSKKRAKPEKAPILVAKSHFDQTSIGYTNQGSA
jgi:hypothetical protein